MSDAEGEEYVEESILLNKGTSNRKLNYKNNTVQIAIWFIISTALLVVYFIQTGGFKAQHGIWMAVILFGCAALYLNVATGSMFTILLFMVGSSAGMVLANAKLGI